MVRQLGSLPPPVLVSSIGLRTMSNHPFHPSHPSDTANGRNHVNDMGYGVPSEASATTFSPTPPLNCPRASTNLSPHELNAGSPLQSNANEAYWNGMVAHPATNNAAVPSSQSPPVPDQFFHSNITPITPPGVGVRRGIATRRPRYGINFPEGDRARRRTSENSVLSIMSPIQTTGSHMPPIHGVVTGEIPTERSSKAAEEKSRQKLADAHQCVREALLAAGLNFSSKAEDLFMIANYVRGKVVPEREKAMQDRIKFLESLLGLGPEGDSNTTGEAFQYTANAQAGPSHTPEGSHYSFQDRFSGPEHS